VPSILALVSDVAKGLRASGTTYQPELGSVVPWRVDTVPDDPAAQVAYTIGLMNDGALDSAATPELQRDAETARTLGNGDVVTGAHTLVRSALRFREDADTAGWLQLPGNSDTVEVLTSPVDLSRAVAAGLQPAEDCDGYAMYVASVLLAAGVPCAYVTVAADPYQPGDYSHVYVAAYPAGRGRIVLDASHGEWAGWECPDQWNRKREWPLRRRRSHRLLALAILAAAAVFATRGVTQ